MNIMEENELRRSIYEIITKEIENGIFYYLYRKGLRYRSEGDLDIRPYRDRLLEFKKNLKNEINNSLKNANIEDLKLFKKLYEEILESYRENREDEAERKSEELLELTKKITGKDIFNYVGEKVVEILSNPEKEKRRRRLFFSLLVLVFLPLLSFTFSQISIQGFSVLSQPSLIILFVSSVAVVLILFYSFFKNYRK